MSTRYTSSFDITLPFSDTCFQIALTANNAYSYTVPGLSTDRYSMLMRYNATSNIFVGFNVTAVVPASNTITTTYKVEYKPCKRYVNGGDVISFITPDDTAWMGGSLRFIPNPSR